MMCCACVFLQPFLEPKKNHLLLRGLEPFDTCFDTRLLITEQCNDIGGFEVVVALIPREDLQ